MFKRKYTILILIICLLLTISGCQRYKTENINDSIKNKSAKVSIKEDIEDIQSLIELSNLYLEENKLNEAIEVLTKLLDADKTREETYIKLAEAYVLLNDIENASKFIVNEVVDKNREDVKKILDSIRPNPPKFTLESGVYDLKDYDGIKFEDISEKSLIYYTTDGTEATVDSILYELNSKIPLKKGQNIIRAILLNEFGLQSEEIAYEFKMKQSLDYIYFKPYANIIHGFMENDSKYTLQAANVADLDGDNIIELLVFYLDKTNNLYIDLYDYVNVTSAVLTDTLTFGEMNFDSNAFQLRYANDSDFAVLEHVRSDVNQGYESILVSIYTVNNNKFKNIYSYENFNASGASEEEKKSFKEVNIYKKEDVEISEKEYEEELAKYKDIDPIYDNSYGIPYDYTDYGNNIIEKSYIESESALLEIGLNKDFRNMLRIGKVDCSEFRINDNIDYVEKSLGKPDYSDYWGGSRYITYNDTTYFGDLFSGAIRGIGFSKGAKLYGFEVGMSLEEMEKMLGTPYTKDSISDGDDFASINSQYSVTYSSGKYDLLIYYDKNDMSEMAFITN